MIVLENINKTYHNGAPLHVLKGIDLEIGKGELVSIMGASGSGKSTLLNILGILDDYDTGEYFLNGRLIPSTTRAFRAANAMPKPSNTSTGWGSATGPTTCPTKCRAARNSAWPSPGH